MGADRRTVVGMVLGQGARLLATLLFGVSPFDPATYAAVAAVLGSVALLASLLPARAASRIPPTEALRGE